MDASEAFTLIPRLLIRLYQKVSIGMPRRCRFYPTCSDYAIQALQSKGLWSGLGLTLRRILKCHPLHPGGYDPLSN
jgi:putative membrane protein insertion efficiency factor